jgi:hypothetical protein
LKVTPSAILPRQKRLEGFRGWWETLLTKNSRGWCVKDLSPIAPSLCKTLRMLTVSLVLILLILGEKTIRTKPEHVSIEYVQILWDLLNCTSM